jgi:NAD(P)-dependent dehydrogenase (short-subunit alcohol dehydrogenase family)
MMLAMPTGIVTGASRGLGLALARALDEGGWRLIVDARGGEALESATAGLQNVTTIAGDVTDPGHRRALVDAAGDRIDVVVNNASLLGPSPQPALADYPLETLRDVYEANVIAPLALLQLALPRMTDGAAVLDITSDAGVEPYEGWGGYGSSKAALEQLSNVLAAEEADVHVYWFDPGDMRTEMHQAAFPGEDISDRPLPETVVPALRRLLSTSPASGRYRAADLMAVRP